jgi:DNA-binding MarR family transcriptional regulator
MTTMTASLDLYRKLILLMMGSKRCMMGLCGPHDITPVQGMLLIIMEPGVAKTMHELSERMGCDASNITGLIDKLEAQKFIERTADEADRRVKMIRLTSRGEDCRITLLEGLRQCEKIDFSKLDSSEQQTFSKLLDKLID